MIIDAKVGSAPTSADWQGSWLYLTVKIPQSDGGGGQFEAMWQAELVVGAVAELADQDSSDLGDVVAGYVVTGQRPDGTYLAMGTAATGDVAPSEMFSGAGLSPSQIVAVANSLAQKYQMSVGAATVLQADGPVPDIRLIDADPAALTGATVDNFIGEMFGSASDYKFAGFNLEIDDDNGSPLFRRAISARTGTFSLWYSPEYTGAVSVSRLAPPPGN